MYQKCNPGAVSDSKSGQPIEYAKLMPTRETNYSNSRYSIFTVTQQMNSTLRLLHLDCVFTTLVHSLNTNAIHTEVSSICLAEVFTSS